jgi:mannan endo-1,6-alpha-mannosidase
MMEYIKTSGDNTYATETVNAITAGSYGTVGDFLGSNSNIGALGETHRLMLGGKWNDDILWWSYASLTGAELFGKDTKMPGGVSYLQLTDKTYNNVMVQQDDVCGGGIYWIRASQREGKNANGQPLSYKSTITNAQAIAHGARLGILTGDKKYFAEADKVYTWMRTSGVMTPQFGVYDAISFLDGQCKINIDQVSYKAGTLAGGLAWLYQGTKGQRYLTDAHNILNQFQTQFTRNGVVFDPCEQGGSPCSLNQVTPKGTAIRGFGYLHEFTNNVAVRAQIKQMFSQSVQAMMRTCDGNWNCGNDWVSGNPPKAYDVHLAMNAMELMTAYLKTFYAGPVGKSGQLAPSTGGDGDGPPPPFSNAKTASYSVLMAVFAFVGIF